ncbi:SsrA-binding protein [Porphyridium purpureum]|uniref:SsrA-binding protein n=1 Tax=Porphyridium purpureum TaxID=35688 RepID=A0A5J4Z4Y9_PORPP|nr:SsrA-binding protein [Porphyridium purpureum]|eukprot:POR6083..scf295_1
MGFVGAGGVALEWVCGGEPAGCGKGGLAKAVCLAGSKQGWSRRADVDTRPWRIDRPARRVQCQPVRMHVGAQSLDRRGSASGSHVASSRARAVGGRRRSVEMMAAKGSASKRKRDWNGVQIENRLARSRYEFLETYEGGLELVGTEVKAVRMGQMQIRDAYCRVSKRNELLLYNANISQYSFCSNFFNHEPKRTRKVLLHKRDILKLRQKSEQQGLTLVPVKCYFNDRGWLKIQVALARGLKLYDKRRELKEKDQKRDLQRALKTVIS